MSWGNTFDGHELMSVSSANLRRRKGLPVGYEDGVCPEGWDPRTNDSHEALTPSQVILLKELAAAEDAKNV